MEARGSKNRAMAVELGACGDGQRSEGHGGMWVWVACSYEARAVNLRLGTCGARIVFRGIRNCEKKNPKKIPLRWLILNPVKLASESVVVPKDHRKGLPVNL